MTADLASDTSGFRSSEIAPGLADAFRDDSMARTRAEAFHFIDCALSRATPIVTPREMWTDQAIVDAVHAGRRDFTPGLT